jgi:hypothetical protein
METIFIATDQIGEPIVYYDLNLFSIMQPEPQSIISHQNLYCLNNKLYGQFITVNNISEENFEIPETCTVCMSTKDEIARKLYLKTPCNHIFCADCVAGVLLNNSVSCPMCRANISLFSDFHFNGDYLNDPEIEFYPLEEMDSELEEQEPEISQEEYDQTLYELLFEYWSIILSTS